MVGHLHAGGPRQSEPILEFDQLPNRRKILWAASDQLALGVAQGGGHIALLRQPEAQADINPFWQPPWPTLEPENVTEALVASEYGGPPEGRLLASVLGHSIALGLYGPPSEQEAAGGEITHGEVGAKSWKWEQKNSSWLAGECEDDYFQLHFSRLIRVAGCCAEIEERIQNLGEVDQQICWQQHVSLGPPFIGAGFWGDSNCDRGATHPESFGAGASLLPATETRWPFAPLQSGGLRDYRRTLEAGTLANDFTGYQVCPGDPLGYFIAGNSGHGIGLFYLWPRESFPWMGVWDEHCARTRKPWAGGTSVRAYEFGCSPFPQLRRAQMARLRMFDLPTQITLPKAGLLWVRYILGAFHGVYEPASLALGAEHVTLLSGERELKRLKVAAGWCGGSKRMDSD
jgi:hypothetical protein